MLYKLKGETVSAGRLAEEAAYIECDELKRSMGKQDHYAAAYPGFKYIRFNNDESVVIKKIKMTNPNIVEIVGHCDVQENKPNCPGFNLKEWLIKEDINVA